MPQKGRQVVGRRRLEMINTGERRERTIHTGAESRE
jgi:hypothetical protein